MVIITSYLTENFSFPFIFIFQIYRIECSWIQKSLQLLENFYFFATSILAIFYSVFLTSNLTIYFIYRDASTVGPKSLSWNPIWVDTKSFTQELAHNAASLFRMTRNCSVTLLQNMHHLSFKRRSFLVAAAIYRSPHIINFVINETITSILLQWLTMTLIYLYTENPVMTKLDLVYKDLASSAKINISFGFMLQSVHNSDEFRYYYAADINSVFLNPMVLSDESGLSFIKSKLRSENFLPNLIIQRPDTKWKFYCVTNITFFEFLLSGVPLGCITQNISSILLKNRQVKCLVSDCNKKPYPRQPVYVPCIGLRFVRQWWATAKYVEIDAEFPLGDKERWRNFSRITWRRCSCSWGSS